MFEWSYTSTSIYVYMVWTGRAFTELLFCHPALRTAVKAVPDVVWPQERVDYWTASLTADVYS
jgi:hypothetical protein